MPPLPPTSEQNANAGDSRSGRFLSTGALIVFLLGAFAIVVAASGAPSIVVPPSAARYPGWLSGPLHLLGLRFGRGSDTSEAEFSVIVMIMFPCYLVLVRRSATVSMRAALAAVVGVHVIFFLGPPLWGTDVFNYIEYARLQVVHGLNAYASIPAAAPHDPVYALETWHHLRNPYGPLFTLFTFALVPLGLAAGLWTLKLATALASLTTLALVARIARHLGRDIVRSVMLVGLNPLFVVYGLGGVHNDAFAELLVMIAVYGVIFGSERRTGVAAVAASAIKTSSLVLLPFMYLGSRQRTRYLVAALVTIAAVIATSLLVFGPHVPNVRQQALFVQPLSAPNLLGLLVGLGGETATLRIVVTLLFAGCCAVLLVRTWRGADWVTSAGWATLALLLGLGWQEPWYVLWVMPFVALSASRRLLRAALAASGFLLLTSLPIMPYVLHEILHLYPDHTRVGLQNFAYYWRWLQ